MSKLLTEKCVQILNMLVEGRSVRAASRVAGVSINTVTKLMTKDGDAPNAEKRYSSAECVGTRKRQVEGNPNRRAVSTLHGGRCNPAKCMGVRRFTRLAYAFSKKIENHLHMLSLHFVHYDFCRARKSLRCALAEAVPASDLQKRAPTISN